MRKPADVHVSSKYIKEFVLERNLRSVNKVGKPAMTRLFTNMKSPTVDRN